MDSEKQKHDFSETLHLPTDGSSNIDHTSKSSHLGKMCCITVRPRFVIDFDSFWGYIWASFGVLWTQFLGGVFSWFVCVVWAPFFELRATTCTAASRVVSQAPKNLLSKYMNRYYMCCFSIWFVRLFLLIFLDVIWFVDFHWISLMFIYFPGFPLNFVDCYWVSLIVRVQNWKNKNVIINIRPRTLLKHVYKYI